MKLSVRCSTGEKFDIEFDPSITVAEFKELVHKQAKIEPARQRLIYRGRVLKDPTLMNSYDVQDGYAIHLVKSPAASSTPASTAPSNTTSTASDQPQQQPPQPQQQAPQPQANPFASMFGSAQPSATPNPFANMFQQAQMNPDMMQSAMNSPMFNALLSNPDMLRELMMANPQLRQIAENNPEVGQLLSDPEMLRRSMEIMRNPNLMREMMRNTDRAMSNIENLPGGFDALRRLYTDIQQPLHEATTNPSATNPLSTMLGTPLQPSDTSSTSSSTTTPQPQNSGPTNTNPLPNPWSSSSTSTPSQPQANPFGSFAMPSMPSMGTTDFSQMSQMMNNPFFQNMMSQMLADPSFMDMMINSNPMLAQMTQQMPQLRGMLSNPSFIQSVMRMQGMMQQQQQQQPTASATSTPQPQPQANPFANFANMASMFGQMQPPVPQQPPTTAPSSTVPPQPSTTTPPLQQQPPQANPFATFNPSFWNQFYAPPQPQQSPQQLYASQNQQLKEMGFYDEATNYAALAATNGNVSAAIEWILTHPPVSTPTPPKPQDKKE